MFHIVFCILLLVIYMLAVMDQLPRLEKRELICLLLFTCNYMVSVGEVSSSSGCLGRATLFFWHSLSLPYDNFKSCAD